MLHHLIKIIATLWVAMILVSCENAIPITNTITSKEDLPSLAIENMNSSYSENAALKGKLIARIMEKYDGAGNPYIKFRQGIYVEFYDENEQIESSLRADYAIYYEKKQLWEATGNVILTNVNGDSLFTEQLFGDEIAEKIYSKQLVTIINADSTTIRGTAGFESNTSFTIYKFINVSGKVNLHEEFYDTEGEATKEEENLDDFFN